MSLGSCQNTVTVEFLELARVTICTMLLGLGNPQNVSFMIIYIYIYIHLLLWAMLCMNLCWPLDHIIQPTMEKSFTSDLEMQGSNLRQIEAPCVPQPTTTVSESFLG